VARKRSRAGAAKTRVVKNGAGKADTAPGASAAGFELRELRQLIRLVQRTGIGELEVAAGGRSVRISAVSSASGLAPAVVPAVRSAEPAPEAPSADAPAGGTAGAPAGNLKAITSPMVGTFYRAPAPDADPFVETGDVVEPGQTVCIVEAMKLMNEIEAEFKGRVVQVLVENAQPIEFGQKLFLIEPA
jgi:acetyl-CoA carboxylase biotin carboxyl carrier protein